MAGDDATDLLLPPSSGGIQVQGDAEKADNGPRLTTFGIDRNFANVLNMGVAYLLVFTAFQTTQMLASSLLGDLGNYSIGIIYVLFTLGGFIAPAVCRKLGPRIGMFAGSMTYVIFVASLIYMIVPVVLLASALIGVGAAVLWTSQGMMMTLCTNDSNKTKYNSIFWGIFGLCVLPGNIAGHFILLHAKDDSSSNSTDTNPFQPLVKGWSSQNSPLFMVLTICGGLGCATFLLLRKPDQSNGSTPTVETRPVSAQIKATIALVAQPKMICLIPMFSFTGVAMTMWASWFTRQMYKVNIGLVMCAFGAAEFVGGFTIGRFVESYGRSPGLIFGTACMMGAFYLTYSGYSDLSDKCIEVHQSEDDFSGSSAKPCKEFDNYGPFYVAAALYGLMDCSFQSISAAICAKSFEASGNTADAWALFRTFQALGAAVCFFISPLLVVSGETYSSKDQLMIEILITGAVGYMSLFGHWLFCKYSYAGTGAKDVTTAAGADAAVHSKAVACNGIVTTSAISGAGPGDQSTLGQTTRAFIGAKAILEDSASSCDRAIKVSILTTAAADMSVVLDRYQHYFVHPGSAPPALSTAVVAELPHKALIQVEVTASQ